MSFLSHGTQRVQQRPLLLLRHHGLSGSTGAMRADSPATSTASPTFSTFTTVRDTHEHTSIDDSFNTDPVHREPYPATSSEFASETRYNPSFNDDGDGSSSPLKPEATSPLTSAVTEFGLIDPIGRYHVRRRMPTPCPSTPCPEVLAQKFSRVCYVSGDGLVSHTNPLRRKSTM
ncbi:hypothetical protein M408DRAFT_232354 [Serendipita vermifera MAFF 305830]|uniref:Uncharacterized protein n=1 Tax=Serendipita vermifera MAFF 305830 TaxID=933852 RepID=A0A0C3AIQ1_SERVB|nr:hypothetical protein M408DRAFT_232354 [Serendipita vermifera MAFF 305830]